MLTDRAEPAAPASCAGRVDVQLVARHAQRVVGFDVLDRVVAGVRVEGVDRVQTVLAGPAAVAALLDVHVHPVLPPPLSPEYATTFRLPTPALTLSGTTRRQRTHHVSATMLPGQKRAIVGAGKRGLARQPSGAVIVIGRKSPEFAGMLPCRSLSSRIERIVR